ncbi:unnamed protein product [Lampetra planeri]
MDARGAATPRSSGDSDEVERPCGDGAELVPESLHSPNSASQFAGFPSGCGERRCRADGTTPSLRGIRAASACRVCVESVESVEPLAPWRAPPLMSQRMAVVLAPCGVQAVALAPYGAAGLDAAPCGTATIQTPLR